MSEGTGFEDSLACAGAGFPEWQEMGDGRWKGLRSIVGRVDNDAMPAYPVHRAPTCLSIYHHHAGGVTSKLSQMLLQSLHVSTAWPATPPRHSGKLLCCRPGGDGAVVRLNLPLLA